MRIAIFCHKFWPAVGGLCTYTGRLAEYLVERGHEVRVFTTRNRGDSPHPERRSERLVIRRFATSLASHPPYYFMPGLLKLSLSADSTPSVSPRRYSPSERTMFRVCGS